MVMASPGKGQASRMGRNVRFWIAFADRANRISGGIGGSSWRKGGAKADSKVWGPSNLRGHRQWGFSWRRETVNIRNSGINSQCKEQTGAITLTH